MELISKIWQTESGKKIHIENPVTNETIAVGVLGQIAPYPILRTGELAELCWVSQRTAGGILRASRFHPIKSN